jgi:flagellar biosynthesis protein FliR
VALVELERWGFSSLLFSLRLTPVLTFGPPFSLTPAPPIVRVLIAIGLSAWMMAARPMAQVVDLDAGVLAVVTAHELLVGTLVLLAFQLMFAAIAMAGRVVDIQAGLGIATLIDPTTRANTPLVGTLFAFVGGMVFFAMGGADQLMRILAASLEAAPLTEARMPGDFGRVLADASAMSTLALGAVGGLVLALFLTDLTIAQLSRTVPQMNVLVLGFQVKTILLLIALPISMGAAAAVMARMVSATLEALPGFF